MAKKYNFRSRAKYDLFQRHNARAVLLMLMEEGMPLVDAKELIYVLWRKGELNFLELEQERRRWLSEAREVLE